MGAEVSAVTHPPIISNPSSTLSLRVMMRAEINAITDLSDHSQSTHYSIATCNDGGRNQRHNRPPFRSFIPCPSVTVLPCVMMRAKISAIIDLYDYSQSISYIITMSNDAGRSQCQDDQSLSTHYIDQSLSTHYIDQSLSTHYIDQSLSTHYIHQSCPPITSISPCPPITSINRVHPLHPSILSTHYLHQSLFTHYLHQSLSTHYIHQSCPPITSINPVHPLPPSISVHPLPPSIPVHPLHHQYHYVWWCGPKSVPWWPILVHPLHHHWV